MEDFLDIANQYIDLSVGYFFNSSKRIYVLYLFISLIWAYYVFYKSKTNKSFFQYIFKKQVWTSRSSKVDYALFLFNGAVKLFLIVPYVYWGFDLAFWVDEQLIIHFDYVQNPLDIWTAVILYTLALTIVTDFLVYVIHYLMHKVPLLWEFHKIHHSATTMNPITQYRIHPFELVVNNLVGTFGFGLVTGVFNYWCSGAISKWTFLGANVFSFVFFIFGATLRHSHVKLRYFNFLEYIFISPVQHQIHHSRERKHWNKNMGSRLAIWDWIFGTLYLSKDITGLRFGLGAGQDKYYRGFWQNMLNPFINMFRKIQR